MRRERLLTAPLAEVMAAAAAVRDETHGTTVTWSPKVFIPLTHLCRDKCGYCTFAQPPARVQAAYLSPDEVLEIARAGLAAGCHEALFTLGERPELRYPAAAEWLASHGYASTVDYLVAMCRLVVEETGLLPHGNAGALSSEELAAVRAVSASQGMMLESAEAELARSRPRGGGRGPWRRGRRRSPSLARPRSPRL
jgi:FO synthase